MKKAIFWFPDKVASWNSNLKKRKECTGMELIAWVCGKGPNP